MQLVEEAKQICQQRQKLLEQQQYDLAVKTTSVEEALWKGEGVLTQQARSLAKGEYRSGFLLFATDASANKSTNMYIVNHTCAF